MSLQGYTTLDTYRYERKFVPDRLMIDQVRAIIRTNPACFHPIFQKRRVNNIYFDTPNLEYYHDNHAGKANRTKIRIRWYGDLTGVIMPILEFKIKKGSVGTKQSFKLAPLSVSSNLSYVEINNCFEQSDLPDDVREILKSHRPVLINSYDREYFQDFSKRFRITIDRDICFYQFSMHADLFRDVKEKGKLVVELKYDNISDSVANDICSFFPFRLYKNSKYISGIEAFYPGIAI